MNLSFATGKTENLCSTWVSPVKIQRAKWLNTWSSWSIDPILEINMIEYIWGVFEVLRWIIKNGLGEIHPILHLFSCFFICLLKTQIVHMGVYFHRGWFTPKKAFQQLNQVLNGRLFLVFLTCKIHSHNSYNMGVSKNCGIPKWMVFNGKPY